METVKLLLGIGESLVGRMLAYDSLSATFSSLEVPRRADCPTCRDPRLVPPIVEYGEDCAAPELVPRD